MKKRFTDEQIIGFLKQVDGGAPVRELCRQHGFSDASFYTVTARLTASATMSCRDCLPVHLLAWSM